MLKIPVNSLVLAAADVATASLPWQAGLRYGLLGLPLAFAALALYVVLPHYYASDRSSVAGTSTRALSKGGLSTPANGTT